MRIKMIKRIIAEIGPIRIGELLTVRKYPDGAFLSINTPYQVIEGEFSGAVIPVTHCILQDEERMIPEKEWIAMEKLHLAKLNKEHEQKERAQEMVKELTQQINIKNNKIEELNSLNELLLLALKSSAKTLINLYKA